MIVLHDEDRRMLESMPRDQLLDLFALHIRNIWRVDGLYFLGIEERFGTESATEIDVNVWRAMGKIEARHLRKNLDVERIEPASFVHLLRNTSWALDVIGKEEEISENKVTFRVTVCGTQETRIRKKLGIFPCKHVRYGYLEAFAKELVHDIEIVCNVCPPDKRPPEVWCEWEFRF